MTKTRWPNARAIWIAANCRFRCCPLNSSVSPGASLARSNTLIQTVKNVSGRDAAWIGLQPWGGGQAVSEPA